MFFFDRPNPDFRFISFCGISYFGLVHDMMMRHHVANLQYTYRLRDMLSLCFECNIVFFLVSKESILLREIRRGEQLDLVCKVTGLMLACCIVRTFEKFE